MKKILFICHGNICRSPMAEFILKNMVREHGLEDDFYIESAAVSREEIGNDIYPPAIAELKKHGIPFEHRRARQMTRDDYDSFDIIFVMDESNIRRMKNIIGNDDARKVRMLLTGGIADPWYTGGFAQTYKDIVRGCEDFLIEYQAKSNCDTKRGGYDETHVETRNEKSVEQMPDNAIIRKSEHRDYECILKIYERARQFMREHGNPNQWNTKWPPAELVREDIEVGRGYVCEIDGSVEAAFVYIQGVDVDPTYRYIEGSWKDDSEYGAVHRIASAGNYRGLGEFCINWAFGQCGHLRMDTHGDNEVMQNLLTKLGFERRGIIYVVEDNYPRVAFEKI